MIVDVTIGVFFSEDGAGHNIANTPNGDFFAGSISQLHTVVREKNPIPKLPDELGQSAGESLQDLRGFASSPCSSP